MSTTFTSDTLPSRFDYDEAQRRLYAFWEAHGFFHGEPDSGREPFTIVIPPPNVTGALHLGHALNNTLQDVVMRFRRMQGYNALWMPGTDHAGIATQAVVEKRLREEEGKTRHDLGREKLVERIWQWKDEYEKRIIGQLKRLGCSCDWERTRFTLDEKCARAVRRTFFDLFAKQLIYRGKRLVNWDTFLQTAVSDDEVFHETIKGHFWHFRYPVIDPRAGEPTHVTIATTRPETMLGDTAVAVHPDPAAAFRKVESTLTEKLASAPAKERDDIQQQLADVRQRQADTLGRLERLRDMALGGRRIMLPLMDREIPLVVDEWAKPEMGSGCVKITPAHDPNDYEVGLRCDLPMINILNRDGTLNSSAGRYQGMTVRESRKHVVDDMEQLGLLEQTEDREIDLAHSDRSKTPIEPYLADQWFVRMERLAQSAMDAVTDGRVEIIPSRYAKGYHDWLEEKRDWPVSRQLWWGHQIPIWSQACPDEASCQQIVDGLESDPAIRDGRATFQVERNESHTSASDETSSGQPWATIHVCIDEEDAELEEAFARRGFQREQDVLDTWFSSALWPHSTLGWPEQTAELQYYYPTSVLITSRDIITLWVARMVLTGLNNMGDVPFRTVYIHPKILDGYGETMSKSKGNGVDPLDVIEKFGADALRFGLAYLTTDTQDVRMPVQFECPHCDALIDQTQKNRQLPRIACEKCGREFSTQWANKDEDMALPRGAVVSERFELARNFCNKLWNAARFSMLNLEGFTPGPASGDELLLEDRWILSRLSTVTANVTDCLQSFRYAEAARSLYEFAWDEFCSFYVEMVKGRLNSNTESVRQLAQRVLAHTLDTLLRLLHPFVPFITEEIWRLLGNIAPQRGLPAPARCAESVMVAPWPTTDATERDEEIEARFSRFQAVLAALREIRSRQGIAPKQPIEFGVRCDDDTARLLQPMELYFASMAHAHSVGWGPVDPPPTHAEVKLDGMDVFVDLKDFIDVDAEIARNEKQRQKLQGMIQGKQAKLSNANFVERAPEEVVDKERQSLTQLREQLASVEEALDSLRKVE
jgi:valyl-tRNA synthetase